MKTTLLRQTIAFLEWVQPRWTGRVTENLFITPPRHRAPSRERLERKAVELLSIPYEDGELRVLAQGQGPIVLLLHGWGGRAGQMGAFQAALAAAGFRAVAVDAPAHGNSPGRQAGIPQFAAALRAAADFLGPIHGVIGHSLGGISTLSALADGLGVQRAVILSAPAVPRNFYRQLLGHLGIKEARWPELEARFEDRVGCRWSDVEGPSLARRTQAPLLMIHDREDREVPFSESVATAGAQSRARLMATTGLGHRRILRDPEVVREAVRFMAG